MKSLVKGFITADIKKMVKTRGERGIELAKPLCEQKDWPPKPVSISAFAKSFFFFFFFFFFLL